jgi:hypothetical protein
MIVILFSKTKQEIGSPVNSPLLGACEYPGEQSQVPRGRMNTLEGCPQQYAAPPSLGGQWGRHHGPRETGGSLRLSEEQL